MLTCSQSPHFLWKKLTEYIQVYDYFKSLDFISSVFLEIFKAKMFYKVFLKSFSLTYYSLS